jgi:hypothetical protein
MQCNDCIVHYLGHQLWGPPSLLSKVYQGSIPGGKAQQGHDADHSPHLVLKSRMNRGYISSSLWCLHHGSGTALLFTLPVDFYLQ